MKKLNINEQQIIELFNKGLSAQKIADQLGFNRSTITFRMNKLGLHRSNSFYQKKKYCNESFFEKINTEEKAYWLGFLFADGNVQQRKNSFIIKLSVLDKEICDNFLKSINANFSTKTFLEKDYYHPNIRREVYHVEIYSKKMFDDLNKLGCIPRKSLVLKFPKIPKKYVRHFIRGYFDGDGWISTGIRKSGLKYISIGFCGTFEFLLKLNEYIPDKGTISKEKRKITNTYRLLKSGSKNALKFYEYFYKNSSIYLKRKYLKFVEYFNNTKDVQRA